MACLFQPNVLPACSSIGGFVHPIPRDDVAAKAICSRAHIHNIRIMLNHSDGTNGRTSKVPIGHISPGGSIVGRFPYAPSTSSHIEGLGLGGNACHSRNTAPSAGTYVPIFKCLKKTRVLAQHMSFHKRKSDYGNENREKTENSIRGKSHHKRK